MPQPTKKWPYVANRHRTEAIMRLGEISIETRRIIARLRDLSGAVDDGNILLSDAIINEVQTRIRLITEMAENGKMTLETAPASAEEDDDD